MFAHNPKGGVLTAHPLPTWVGILLTVWLLLTVCHEYGVGVGYDLLAPGLSYSLLDEVLIFINRAPGDKGLL